MFRESDFPCRKYSIGGLDIVMYSRVWCDVLDRLPGFAVFADESLSQFDMTLYIEHVRSMLRYTTEVHSFELNDERGWCHMFVGRKGSVWYRFDSENLMVHDRDRAGFVHIDWRCHDDDELRYMLWLAYAHQALPFEAVPVHASAVVYRGKAVLFLGESGTGKSTHAQLWLKNFDGTSLLNDDSPVVRVERDGVWAYGSPWSGKTPCFRQERYPVAALVRLRQAPKNRIERLPVLPAFTALLPSCPPTLMHEELCTDKVVDIVGKVIERVPVYMLDCRPDDDAAQLSRNTVF